MRFTNFVIVVLLSVACCSAQPCHTDAKLIGTRDAFLESVKSDPKKKLVAIQKLIPGLIVEMPYATSRNFTKTILYTHPVAYLREEPAWALKQIQQDLSKKGLALKIYDAYRPFSATCIMWRLVPDRRYAANPRKGSNHNRAVALDLTIINLKTGKELDMGTPFDNFTDTAHHDFTQLPEQVLANRRLLKGLMWKYGFTMVPTEWWHYQWRNRQDYEILDLSFDELKDIVQ
jgi:zinc D-Ala-D-Ala dipeptidase